MTSTFIFLGLAFWLIPLLLLLGSVAGLVFLFIKVGLGVHQCVQARNRLNAPADQAPDSNGRLATCGACGYSARGAVGFTCSECGADLREVGIVARRQRRPMLAYWAFALMWSLFLIVPALTVATLAAWLGPTHRFKMEYLELAPIHSGAYQSIDIDYDETTFFENWVANQTGIPLTDSVSLWLYDHSHNTEWLEIDPDTMTFDPSYVSFTPPPPAAPANATERTPGSTSGNITASTPENTPGSVIASTPANTPANPSNTTPLSTIGTRQPVDQAVLLAWMQNIGIDTTRPEVIAEADELLSILQQIPSQGLTNVAPVTFSVPSQSLDAYELPKLWWALVCLGLVPAAWIAGLIAYAIIKHKYDLPNTSPAQTPTPCDGPTRFAPSAPASQPPPPMP